jgi:hypothetical protein
MNTLRPGGLKFAAVASVRQNPGDFAAQRADPTPETTSQPVASMLTAGSCRPSAVKRSR